ncbi:mitochondrial peptide methionine sulfoxide reductase [Garra rufa]|uniref:mitochondrial peptide methionine sulfoxide reductase n=1 Tax=Garra rufa TaxID=137080 RepID=UPI003CCE7593
MAARGRPSTRLERHSLVRGWVRGLHQKWGVEEKDLSWEMGRKRGEMLQRGNEEGKKSEQREKKRNREGGGEMDECKTGHAEVVRVVYEPEKINFAQLLKVFWESHNPTQGMRQGNDVGTTYRSSIYVYTQEQLDQALHSKDEYQKVLTEEGFGAITTEIAMTKEFYYAEDYHQQYLSKNPNGYCGLGGTGVSCPIALKSNK